MNLGTLADADGKLKDKRQVPMKVIVHGLHRTGTMSTRTALHQLGIHNCYHMVSAVRNQATDCELWIRALEVKFDGKGEAWKREDWDRILGESQACVDLPAALFTVELAAAYPEAKVVMLIRDAEAWYESTKETVREALQPTSVGARLQRLYCAAVDAEQRSWTQFVAAVGKGMPFDHGKEKEKAIAWFNRQYQDVRDAVAAERRLEFSVKDGFGPLCEHLGVPVPMVRDEETGEMVEAPFPHINDRAAFAACLGTGGAESLAKANQHLVTLVSKAVVALGALSYGGYLLWRARLGGRF